MATPSRRTSPREIPDGPTLGAAIVPAGTVTSGSVSPRIPVLLWIALAVSLIVVGVAVAPRWVLPGPVGIAVAARRESLFYTGTATVIVIGLCFLIARGQS